MSSNIRFSAWLANRMIRPLFKVRALEACILRAYALLRMPILLKLVPLYDAYPPGTMRTCCRDNINYHLDISTLNGWRLYYHRSRNADVPALVSPGDHVVDVGANIGEVTLRLARAVGDGGGVTSFEPNPAVYRALESNVALNPGLMNRVSVHNLAVGSHEGVVEMTQPDPRNPGTMTIKSGGQTQKSQVVDVKVVVLDEYLERINVPKVDMIKIDVEGFEMEVIRGSRTLIRKYKPKLLVEVCDQHLRRHGESASALIKLIQELGYKVHVYGEGTPVSLESLHGDSFFDVLCEMESA